MTADSIYMNDNAVSSVVAVTNPVLKTVFLELNTAVSATVACEHLSGIAGHVFAELLKHFYA